MNASDLFAAVTEYSRPVIAALLVLTVLVGAGAPMVEQSSSLDQFQSDSTAAEKLDYINSNFSSGDQNQTTVQLIVRDENGNVLSKDALIETLRLQQALRNNATVNRTLANETPTAGVANIVATVAIRQEQASELRKQGAQLQQRKESLNESRAQLQQRSRQLNRTAARLSASLNRTRELQARYDRLNASIRQGEVNNSTYRQRSQQIETRLQQVRTGATANLSANRSATYVRAFEQVRGLQQRLDRLNASLQQGEINQSTYRQRAAGIRSQFEQVYRLGTRGVLADEYRKLQQRAADLQEKGQQLAEDAQQLQERRQQLQNASSPTLSEQIDQLQSMNRSEVESSVTTVLSEGGSGPSSQAFAFMPTSYEPGSTQANATMLVVFQQQGGQAVQSMASNTIVESQTAMRQIAEQELDREVLVFGSGIISEETQQSMADSIAIVGPMALLFVVLTLIIAYRDLLDILLGVFGIAVVLVWTFGFMGWADITFNQIFIAVPVLLIGLSIDYAIHVFMRHREEREEHEGESVRQGMSVALASVGVALVWVTATTVIGFMSNLVSPLPPIQDFGIVSSVGILAALVVFGGLIPALKVEIDGFLESRGFDRKKRAFGTGGGALGSMLSVGAVAARKAPFVVIALTLVLSAGGAYGATQVDTSFSQTDFLAEDPPNWMKDLPEPFAPGTYTAKANLEYVNENFLRQDSQAQILVEGDVATAKALEKLQQAKQTAAGKEDVVVVLSNGEPQIRSPLSVMDRVAAQNESFNQTLAAADTDGDGVPDRNVEKVFDKLFAVAPQEAKGVISRQDGEYEAARMVVSVKGGASSSTVTTEMRAIAANVEGGGLTATATGQPIVFEIVQKQLLDTVIQSLLITLGATFAFLMIAYRLAHGSAVLGAITLLPVAFSVSWILGTMYLLGMPFNVLTGMITSLTVGLGVAYSIHLSERYTMELGRRDTMWAAMRESVTGTGGALLGSAATTVGGFGVLAFAILPALQQFGIITGLTIIYAFLASVLVLPSLLALWTRYLGPDEATDTDPSSTVAQGATEVSED
ncbi:MMPL family transporter [Halorussus gelatinilyticus]|uniref:MMPL family transporter n=1 Tax=Halorussus gelatinilyticus TaxID=2937524 RepID=A0A8U0IFJ0_9EURY|nr:MMPL family transporter [Halorussus gelatinilyticus]UPV99742.1 MMPL family transporter [Halorussus gelatinilyticus]